MVLGWPVPPRGGLTIDEHNTLLRLRAPAKRAAYLRTTLPVNAVLVEAWADNG